MTSKTPVSILNEYMFRTKQIPQFELINGSTGHETVFEYVVSVDEVTAKGVGRSKKEAKHNAAYNALEKLVKCNKIDRSMLLMTCGSSAVADSSISSVAVSPYAEQVTENTVGSLATLCGDHDLPSPEYKIVDESGPPHCRTFTMHCTLCSIVGIGVSRTKKQAKHIAAKNMIEKLQEHLSQPSSLIRKADAPKMVPPTDSKKHDAAIDLYCSIKEKERGGVIRENMSLNLATCHLKFKELTGPYAEDFKVKRILEDDLEGILQRFAEEQNVTLSFSYINAIEVGRYVCAAALSTTPDLVQLGYGNDEDTAKEIAAFNLLKAIIAMLIE